MPKLNLDIFSPSRDAAEESPQAATAAESVAALAANLGKEVQTSPPARSESAPHKRPTSKFIPVGFHEEHLRLLDEAILRLRRRGEWQASKSGLIRRLILLHKDELEQVYLDGRGDG